jgi:hypothetical protein
MFDGPQAQAVIPAVRICNLGRRHTDDDRVPGVDGSQRAASKLWDYGQRNQRLGPVFREHDARRAVAILDSIIRSESEVLRSTVQPRSRVGKIV